MIWPLSYTGNFIFPVIFCCVFLIHESFAQENYFYTGKNYGSEKLFNPVSLVLNGSLDIIQLENFSRRPSDFRILRGNKNVSANLLAPFSKISQYGWRKFLSTEVLPIEFRKKNAQWWPNYQLHLIGGGMSYAALEEYYRYYNFQYPKTYSALSIFTYHYLNEIIENNAYSGVNVDPIADIYVFDLGGCILFSSETVKRFFSKTLHLRDWSLQPSYSLNTQEIHNNGQYFSMKWFPFGESQYGIFYYFGINGITGISYKVNEHETFSFGGGLRAKKHLNVNTALNQKTVETVWTAGAFWDKDGSLMTSVFFSGLSDYFANLNIYPGVIETGTISTGLWIAANRKGKLAFGINILGLPGLGISNLPVD